MSVRGLTRVQLRQAIAPFLGGYVSSASENGTTTTLVDNTLSSGAASDNTRKDGWMDFTSGANSGLVSQVTASTVATSKTTFTFAPARTSTVSADTYIWWPAWVPVSQINRLLDEAVKSTTGRFYDDEESLALCGDGEMARFDLPSEFAMLKEVWHRYYIEDKTVHEGTAAYDESVDADFTVTVDSEDKLGGESSIKFVVAGTASNGDIASDSISSLDLSGCTHIEFWIKVVTAVAANDLRYRLSATVNGGTETESLNIPALTALTKTKVRIALANPQSDTAIISVALEYNANVAANTIWISRVKAVRDNTALWEEIPRHLWYIDHEARDLILEWPAVARISGRLIKLKGGDNAATFSADSSTSEVPEEYLKAYVIYHALYLTRYAQAKEQIAEWKQAWKEEYSRLPSLDNVRRVG